MSSQEFNLRKADGAFLPTASSSSLAPFFFFTCLVIRFVLTLTHLVFVSNSQTSYICTFCMRVKCTYHTNISTFNLIYDIKWAAKKWPMPYCLGRRIAAIAFHKLNPIFAHKLRIYRMVAIAIVIATTVDAFPNTHKKVNEMPHT